MKCSTCGGQTFKSTTTSVTDLGNCIVIIRNVPCYKCEECNEILYTLDVTERLEEIINQTKQIMQGIAVLEYSSAT